MSWSLHDADSLAHLRPHRSLILGRSLVAGAAGLVPVPYVDDALAAAARGALLRRLAELGHVDVDDAAVRTLATPRPSLLGTAGLGALVLGGVRRAWRKVAASLLVMRRMDEAIHTFQVGTLFDHYCARHHVGFGLDERKATLVRNAMDEAILAVRAGALEQALRRALMSPRLVAQALPRLVARRRPAEPGPYEAEAVDALELRRQRDDAGTSLSSRRRALGRALARVEADLERAEERYVAALVAAFDTAWAPHKPALGGARPEGSS